jgi:hypothetical protein
MMPHPENYMLSETLEELKKEKVLILQTAWRGYMSRKKAWARREILARREVEERERLLAASETEEAENAASFHRKVAPSSMKEFSQLYSELDAWKNAEVAKINSMENLSEEERVGLLQTLLERQTKVLQTIDRMKSQTIRDSAHKRRETVLRRMAQPKMWENSDGKTTSVHTPSTTRASELLRLYEALCAPIISIEDRMDILLHIKHTVSEFKSHLTTNIIDLASRETDLLTRGRGLKSMEGLRKRIRNLFMQFMETPEYNPQIQEYIGFEEEQEGTYRLEGTY